MIFSGCDPLTPDDVAEVIVFAAGRGENVVVADTLMFPSHQVRARAYLMNGMAMPGSIELNERRILSP